MDILDVARRNQQKAWEIIEKVNVIPIWESIGAQVNLVGSLRMGLLMKHRDIDFHIYTSSLSLADSFRAMAKLAENTSVKKIECVNLLHTVEACVEWHAWYQDSDNALWQIDMIHIRKGSRYDGYFEKVAERISSVLTDEIKRTILQLKNETPESEKIMDEFRLGGEPHRRNGVGAQRADHHRVHHPHQADEEGLQNGGPGDVQRRL